MAIGTEFLARIAAVLREGPGLRLAVLFGQTARGEHRLDSDVDVGIVPIDPDLPLPQELELQRRLEEACRRRVDLVRLDQASTLLKWRVANDGEPVVSDPPPTWSRFVAASAIEYAELATQLQEAEERFRARLVGENNP